MTEERIKCSRCHRHLRIGEKIYTLYNGDCGAVPGIYITCVDCIIEEVEDYSSKLDNEFIENWL
jgi:hypothetical protein